MEPAQAKSFLTVPMSILIAGALIAATIIWTNVGKTSSSPVATSETEKDLKTLMKPVTSEDHILGNPNASIKIVEYSDPSCPYCKIFHMTMKKLIDVYGSKGDVAWVYRHFPIDKPDAQGHILHPNAGHEAQATECAAQLGGNQKFWAYTNRLYDVTPSVTGATPNGLDQKELPKIAAFVGLDVDDFNSCLSSGKFKEKVEGQYLEAVNLGLTGTPSSILITPSGEYIPLEGALPYEQLKQALDALIAQKGN